MDGCMETPSQQLNKSSLLINQVLRYSSEINFTGKDELELSIWNYNDIPQGVNGLIVLLAEK